MDHIVEDPAPSPDEANSAPSQRHGRQSRWLWVGLGMLGLGALVAIALVFLRDERPATPAVTLASPSPVAMMRRSWILRPTLPATATQADSGAQVYRLVCSTCHGYEGEGLDYESWGQMAAPVENCWQAKCHGGAHPVDGFALPRHIPPVMGTGALARFPNARALYEYVRAAMPWQDRGSMLDEEYWEVTAFLVRSNGFDPILTPLDPARAAEVPLR